MKHFFSGLIIALLSLPPLFAQHQTHTRKTGILSPTDKIHAYFFQEKTHRLQVIDEADYSAPHYGSLSKAMTQYKCQAGVNGGYFGADKEGTPLGMVVQNGKQIHPIQSGAFSVSGLVYDTGKKIQLVRSKDYLAQKEKPTIANALQGGPFLIEKGRIVTGLNNTRRAYRTFIATDGKGKWCIATTSALTLHELAEWLHENDTMGNFSIHMALNLDGGSSSSYWVKKPDVYYPSIKKVRNYLGVAPR